ncbi:MULTISPECIES: GntR family transcriptional regulator [unclassified Nocardioides]|jgi:DNA-binding GntR family transcriptional regulator|uniref:GntR family transcriptional regulator n=1 Tax=unclassified Nocardioides TaxID=2615069 RepID=UPI00114DA29A|nr:MULTISPECIES: GntR family transcriptional regulator [unclassified Nocardioides]TQK69177.1 DNA-binding GntR family transcriptional regulator [Nocardioides sp. SLBN-35]WGY01517.1 GntR family transcriptional regulator [Nocardioides sp. QY071]
MAGPSTPPKSPFTLLSVENESTVSRVAAEVRRAIFEGDLESGTPLREIALAESLGVSRPTVREALTVLVAEGLATREPHRGVMVATPRAESVRDVCRARWVLEGAGVLAWPAADAVRRARVRTTLDAYTAAVRSGEASYEELNERHLAFHVSLVELTGSARLVQMAEALMDELRLALAQVERINRNAHDEAGSHEGLVALLEADRIDGPDGAHAFLRKHIDDAEIEIVEALGLE